MTETGIVKYDITDAAISEMESIYMALTITDLDDKEQFDAVHSARMTVKGKRVEVEKRRKELKADAIEWGRKVDAEAKRIFGKLEPIESHLDREERKVTDEQKRIKEEADRKQKEKIDARLLALAKANCNLPFFDVAGMTDDEYEDILRKATEAWEIEQKRIYEEAIARKDEAERLERVRQEQAAEAARMAEEKRKIDEAQAAERKKIEDERKAIEAEKRALEDAKRKEQERKDREAFEVAAKEKAKMEAEKAAEEKAEREKIEAEKKAEREAVEKARQEALKTDKDRLILYGKALMDVPKPELKDKAAKEILGQASGALYQILKNISKKVEEL
jgi:hypothetical protein